MIPLLLAATFLDDVMTTVGPVLFWVGVVVLGAFAVGLVLLAGMGLAGAIASRRAKLVAWDCADPTLRDKHTVHDPDRVQALLEPDWEAYRARYGHEPPRALVNLYANRDLVLCQDFVLCPETDDERNAVLDVWGFVPVPEALHVPESLAQLNTLVKDLGEAGFYFAGDTLGNAYCLRPAESGEGDPPVYLVYHDDDEIERVCDSLDRFLAADRFIDPGTSGFGCLGFAARRRT